MSLDSLHVDSVIVLCTVCLWQEPVFLWGPDSIDGTGPGFLWIPNSIEGGGCFSVGEFLFHKVC